MIRRAVNCLSERAHKVLQSVEYVDQSQIEMTFTFIEEDGEPTSACVSISESGECFCYFNASTFLSSEEMVLIMEVIHDLKGEFKKC